MTNTESLWATFFSLESVGGLKSLRAELDLDKPAQRAFGHYVDSWGAISASDEATSFDPHAHLSEDLSCAIYHGCPCIFMGSNSWAAAAEYDPESNYNRLSSMAVRMGTVRKANPDAVIVVAVIPEKDYLIDRMFTQNNRGSGLTNSLAFLKEKLGEFDIHMVFDAYLSGLAKYQTIEDYKFSDSHLPSANYIQTLSAQLAFAGTPWSPVSERLSIKRQPEYGDLVDKLRLGLKNPIEFSLPLMAGEPLELIGGAELFSDPLGDTNQIYTNPDPIDARKLLLLGDSHCSIYSRKKLTYLNASIFAETTFQWNPCGFRSDVGPVPQPVIFMEIAQRFLFTR